MRLQYVIRKHTSIYDCGGVPNGVPMERNYMYNINSKTFYKHSYENSWIIMLKLHGDNN